MSVKYGNSYKNMHTSGYNDVWQAALRYLRARKNDVHIPISFLYAQRLLDLYPQAVADVVFPAVILHDAGWALIDERVIFEEGFGPKMMESDVRFLHEREGARIARELLPPLGYPATIVEEIAQIIDGHDTRRHALSLNDQLVKDADKLWRFTTTGIAVACDWFKQTPTQYASRLEDEIISQLFTPGAIEMARQALQEARAALRCDVLP